ncbi:zf-HC2 domain-containing protein [bacterium]|nr:zf-HC2 domain-containing protein [candidate division CSSED10-310 bacterium]
MKCRDFQFLLDEYLDGELQDQLADEVILHKNECRRCQIHYNRRIRLFQMMKTARDPARTSDLSFKIMREVGKRQVPRAFPSHRIPVLAAVLVSLSVGALILFLGIGTIMDGFTFRDAVGTLVGIVGLPGEIQQNLDTLQRMASGWIIALKTLVIYLSSTVSPVSYIALIVLIGGILLGFGFWLNRHKTRKGYVSL